MSRRLLASLIAGAAVAMACYFWVIAERWPPPNLVFYLGTPSIALSFMVAGIAAWLRWPASRLGLLLTVVGYLDLLPVMDYLNNPPAFPFGNVSAPFSAAGLAHLGLSWPIGRV